MNLLFSLLFIW